MLQLCCDGVEFLERIDDDLSEMTNAIMFTVLSLFHTGLWMNMYKIAVEGCITVLMIRTKFYFWEKLSSLKPEAGGIPPFSGKKILPETALYNLTIFFRQTNL